MAFSPSYCDSVSTHHPSPLGALPDAVQQCFADGGPLAQALPGFRQRPGQTAIAGCGRYGGPWWGIGGRGRYGRRQDLCLLGPSAAQWRAGADLYRHQGFAGPTSTVTCPAWPGRWVCRCALHCSRAAPATCVCTAWSKPAGCLCLRCRPDPCTGAGGRMGPDHPQWRPGRTAGSGRTVGHSSLGDLHA